MAVFLRLQAGDPALYDDEAICVALRTLLIGGYETTAATLGWMGAELSRNPALVAELEAAADQGQIQLFEALANETLRFYPAIAHTGRVVVKPFELDDGFTVPVGAIIFLLIPTLHRRPDVYDHPDRFDPGRFLREKANPYKMISFGGRIRRCLGGPFAVAEMTAIMQTICSELHFNALSTPAEKARRRHVMTVPSRGGQVLLTAR